MVIKKRNEFILAVLFMLWSGFFYQQTYAIRKVMAFSLGPLVFPRIILGVMFVLSLCLLFQNIGFGATEPASTPKIAKSAAQRQATVFRLALVGLLFVYLLALPHAGYVPSTMAFLFLGMALLGLRTPRQLAMYAVISAAVTLALQFLFGSLLKLFLP